MQLLIILIFFFIVVYSKSSNGAYFNEKDLIYAECVPEKKYYAYFGSKNVALDGRKCEEWSKVRIELEFQMKGYYQYYFKTEYETHDQCRTILLDQYERKPSINNASAHSFVDFDGWQKGPWCYVKILKNETKSSLWYGKFKSNYKPWPCFSFCSKHTDSKTTTTESPSTVKTTKYYYHYNADLIEHLSDRFFNNLNKPETKKDGK